MVKINMSIPFMVIFVCAWYFKMLIPMLIWCVMFLMLRNYIGGYHAKTHFRCILYSSVYGVIAMYGIIWLAVVPLCNLLEYLTQRDIQTKNSGVNVRYRGKHRFFKGFNEFIKEKTRRCDNDFEKIERHVFF